MNDKKSQAETRASKRVHAAQLKAQNTDTVAASTVT